MGKPVKIIDLAQDMINLSGLSGDSIKICFTGLRPGEKLHEELFYSYEKVGPTIFQKIGSVAPVDLDCERFWQELERFLKERSSMEEQALRQRLFSLASSFVTSEKAQSAKTTLRAIKN